MWLFFFSSRRRHTRYWRDWSSDVCSSDLRSHSPTGATQDRPGSAPWAGRPREIVVWPARGAPVHAPAATRRVDRKSVVEGKRGDLGGRRIIKKKNRK